MLQDGRTPFHLLAALGDAEGLEWLRSQLGNVEGGAALAARAEQCKDKVRPSAPLPFLPSLPLITYVD